MSDLSYHDLYVTVEGKPRFRFSDMNFGYMLICTRVGGWQLWHKHDFGEQLVAGEYHTTRLRLDVNGQDIVNSLPE